MYKVNLPSSASQKIHGTGKTSVSVSVFLLERDTMNKVTYTIKHLNRGLLAVKENQNFIILVGRVAAGRHGVLAKYLSAHI